MACLILFLLALANFTKCHFILNAPPGLGFSGNDEDTAPCGGFTVDFNNGKVNDFHVGGEAIGLTTLHAQSNFAFRAAVGNSVSGGNVTLLTPSLVEYGLGAFCVPGITAPSSWAGTQGMVQVIQAAEDGVHYQVCFNVEDFVTVV